jgi:hypothetical protein
VFGKVLFWILWQGIVDCQHFLLVDDAKKFFLVLISLDLNLRLLDLSPDHHVSKLFEKLDDSIVMCSQGQASKDDNIDFPLMVPVAVFHLDGKKLDPIFCDCGCDSH